MDFETELFTLHPWSADILTVAKTLNDSALLRVRTGWKNRGIDNGETIYEHILKTSLATHYLTDDPEQVLVAVSHDLCEIYGRDYTPGEVDKQKKYHEELQSITRAATNLPRGDQLQHAWHRYESGAFPLVKQLDKIDPNVQAQIYLETNPNIQLQEFYEYTKTKLNNPDLCDVLENIWKPRQQSRNHYTWYFSQLKAIQEQTQQT